MSDLYLSAEEAKVLRYATIIWGCLQWWDIIDRYVIRRFIRTPGSPTTPPTTRNGASTGRADDRAGTGIP